jgi:hypothetical protein
MSVTASKASTNFFDGLNILPSPALSVSPP